MIVTTSCPLRISLVGGSTDHPLFLKKYKRGSVISFPCNLKTYVSIHRDVFGANSLNKRFVLNYSKREEVDKVSDIQNEMVRFCFEEFDVEYMNLFLTSDVYSNGSGLASSSAYLIALIKSILVYKNIQMSDFDICKVAMSIEKKFNPLVGQQDFYGSLGDLKRINFFEDRTPEIGYLDKSIFSEMSMYLLYTNITRSSTSILQTLDIDKCCDLLDDVRDLESAIKESHIGDFNYIIRRTWENKKITSKEICSNEKLMLLDEMLKSDDEILSHKLLGAGNGGYFLIFSNKDIEDSLNKKYGKVNKIYISGEGPESTKI